VPLKSANRNSGKCQFPQPIQAGDILTRFSQRNRRNPTAKTKLITILEEPLKEELIFLQHLRS